MYACALILACAARCGGEDIVDLSFSYDGRYLAALRADGTLSAFDTMSGAEVFRLDREIQGPTVAWRPGTHELAAPLDAGAGWDIWLLGLDGARHRLTQYPAKDAEPQWTRGGSQLLFVSYRKGDADLYCLEVGADAPRATPRAFLERPHDQWSPQAQPDGEAVAYLSIESGYPEIWIAWPEREPRCVALANDSARFQDVIEFAWETTGRRLLYIEGDATRSRLHAVDPETLTDIVLIEEPRIASARLDLAHGDLLWEADGVLWRRPIRWDAEPIFSPVSSVLDASGLALGRATIGPAAGPRLWACSVEGRGVALSGGAARGARDLHLVAAATQAPPERLELLYTDFEDRLYMDERLYRLGRAREAEVLYDDLAARPISIPQVAAMHFHHAVQLRRNGQPREAIGELQRLANTEPPAADPMEIMAAQGRILLFEMNDPASAYSLLDDVARSWSHVPTDVAEPLAFLKAGTPELTRYYCEAHRALRHDESDASLLAMLSMARLDAGNPLVQGAILNLLNYPYDAELIEERPNVFDAPGLRKQVVEILETLEQAAASGPAAPVVLDDEETSGSELLRLRQELCAAQEQAGLFEEARRTLLDTIRSQGVEDLELPSFLRFYIQGDRFGRPIHRLLGEVLLDPEIVREVEKALADDPLSLVLLPLAQIKVALLEGNLDIVEELLVSAARQLHGFGPERRTAEVVGLQARLYLFSAKYNERRRNWALAAASYQTARSMALEHEPEEPALIFDIDIALALAQTVLSGEGEEAGPKSQTRGPANPDELWQLQAIQRAAGDPLINIAAPPEHLRGAAVDLARMLGATPGPTALEPFALYEMARCLNGAGASHSARYYYARALSAEPPKELRIGVLSAQAQHYGENENWWLQWAAYDALSALLDEPGLCEMVHLRMARSLLQMGRRGEALALVEGLGKSASLVAIRAAATSELDLLREIEAAALQGE